MEISVLRHKSWTENGMAWIGHRAELLKDLECVRYLCVGMTWVGWGRSGGTLLVRNDQLATPVSFEHSGKVVCGPDDQL